MVEVDAVSPRQEATGRRSPPTAFRADIEGFRGVTLLAILLFHVDMPGVSGGFVGPDIFFIISGFVITGQLWREVSGTGKVGFRRFYAGRARRLLPVSAVIGVATIIGSIILLPPLEVRRVIDDGIACETGGRFLGHALDGLLELHHLQQLVDGGALDGNRVAGEQGGVDAEIVDDLQAGRVEALQAWIKESPTYHGFFVNPAATYGDNGVKL